MITGLRTTYQAVDQLRSADLGQFGWRTRPNRHDGKGEG